MPDKPYIINFDHHSTNEFYGNCNMVAADTSSTAEVLYNFFKHNNITIDSTIATCLLTGLISDTDFFTNDSTSISSLNIASKLISSGGNTQLIKELMFMDKSIDALKLWGLVLSRLKKHEHIDIVYTYITLNDLKKYNVSEAASEGVANFMNNINESKAVLVLKEMPDNKIRGSFRTIHDDIDVGEISKQLGGGGHQKAAGFMMDGPLKRAAKEVFETIKTFKYLNT
jgi:phosphoesterase RecJ-like protein